MALVPEGLTYALSLFAFEGRLSRLGYWRQYLLVSIASAVTWCAGLFGILAFGRPGAILFVPALPIVVAYLAIGLRRAHDRDHGAGWWAMVSFCPFATAVIGDAMFAIGNPILAWTGFALSLIGFGLSVWGFIEPGFLRGAPGSNRFGAAPA